MLQSELTGEMSKELEEHERSKYSLELDKLTTALEHLERDSANDEEFHKTRMEDARRQYSELISKFRTITSKLMKNNNDEYR